MKKVICIAVVSFCFLGVSSTSKTPQIPSERLRQRPIVETPQIDQEVKLWQNKLKVQNSELKVGIAEFIFKQ